MKCSDGSYVFIYDITKQGVFKTGGTAPTNEYLKFDLFQFKYADMRTIDHQIQYNLYWVQTFKSVADVENYVKKVDHVEYDVVK